MNVLFHPDAELEFNAAIDYNEAVENGLVTTFRLSLPLPSLELLLFKKGVGWVSDSVTQHIEVANVGLR